METFQTNWDALCASLLHLLKTRESQEETMVQSFGALNEASDKWETFLILADSNLRSLDVIRQLQFEMRALLATLKAMALSGATNVKTTLKKCGIDPPGSENLQKILLGFQEDWNFHPPLETAIQDIVDTWITACGQDEPLVARKLTLAGLQPIPFDSEALDLTESARSLLIEGMPLAIDRQNVVCAGEKIPTADFIDSKDDLSGCISKIIESQKTYDDKHGEILSQLEGLCREKNRLDAQARGFSPQDKKAPITQQHNLAVVNFQIDLLRRMALTLEINEARNHSRLIQCGALLWALGGETAAAAHAGWFEALNALESQLRTKITRENQNRKDLFFAISALNADLDNLENGHAIPQIDQSIALRDRLAENQIKLETSEAQLNRLHKIKNRVRKLKTCITASDKTGAERKTKSAPLHVRFSFGKTGAKTGWPLKAYGLAACPGGGLIAADYEFHQVCVFDADGTLRLRFGGWGNAPGAFKYPIAVAADSQGCIHVADEKNRRIQKFTAAGEFLLAYGDTGADEARLGPIFCLAIDGDRVWVPDPTHNRIHIYDTQGKPVRNLTPESGDPEAALRPASVCAMDAGRHCIGDASDHALRLYGSDGVLIAGLKKEDAGCGEIYALAFHPDHGLFAADYWGGKILHLDAGLHLFAVWDNGGRRSGQWGRVSGLAIAGGRLFVSDCDNARIQAFDLEKLQ